MLEVARVASWAGSDTPGLSDHDARADWVAAGANLIPADSGPAHAFRAGNDQIRAHFPSRPVSARRHA